MTAVSKGRLLAGSVLDDQLALEERAVESGVERYRKLVKSAIDRGDGARLKPVMRVARMWGLSLKAALELRIPAINARNPVAPYLRVLDPELLAACTLLETLNTLVADPMGTRMTDAAYLVGRSVWAEHTMQHVIRPDPEKRKRWTTNMKVMEVKRRRRKVDPVKYLNWWAHRYLDEPRIDGSVAIAIGGYLIRTLASVAYASDDPECKQYGILLPKIHRHGKRIEYVRLHDDVWQLIERGHEMRAYLRPRYLPMVVPPYKWSEDAEGGYVQIRTPIIINPYKEHKEALANQDLSSFYEALDAVATGPLDVDAENRDLAMAEYEWGGGDLGIPPANDPVVPESIEKGTVPDDVWKQRCRERAHAFDRARQLKSQRATFHRMMDVANEFAGRAIYYPHQADFRGRLYPIPQHLNWQGPDICRGMLRFHEPKPIGERGIWWLKVHLANCYGFDKGTFESRVEWTEANEEEIVRCGHDPEASEFWRHADGGDKPWQFLAAAREFAQCDGDPGYMSRLPIQMDGKCNGLQHFAALGLDESGARTVSMLPADEPGDIYSDVLAVVAEWVEQDAANGNKQAQFVRPHMDRKAAKLVVMPCPYGITLAGAKKSLSEYLSEKMGLKMYDTADYKKLHEASMYLARKLLDGTYELCPSAKSIMEFFRETSRVINKAGHLLTWTSPIGFPVVQRYYGGVLVKPGDKRWANTQSVVFEPDNKSSVTQGVQGSAPNVVHSLDASHLMFSAIACADAGITMLPVHDSFSTHARDVDEMLDILRDQFVTMYEADPLMDFHSQQREKHPDLVLPEPPERGSLDLDLVRGAGYMFS